MDQPSDSLVVSRFWVSVAPVVRDEPITTAEVCSALIGPFSSQRAGAEKPFQNQRTARGHCAGLAGLNRCLLSGSFPSETNESVGPRRVLVPVGALLAAAWGRGMDAIGLGG